MAVKKAEKSLEQMLEETLLEEDEQPYNVPGNWVFTKLGSVCTKPQYGWTTKAKRKGDVFLLRTSDITSDIVDWQNVPYCSEVSNDLSKYLLKEDDIVISRAGSIGVSYLIEKPKKAVFASYLIRFNPLINKKYVYLFLKSPLYWNDISEKSSGIALPNINATKLGEIRFPLPPLPEQERIVKKLSSILGKLIEARELIQEAKDSFEERRAAILNKAFTGELTKKWREENPDVASAEKLIEILITEKKKQRKEGKKENIPTHKEMIIEEGGQPYNLPGNWEWVKIGYLLCEVAKKDPKREGIKKFTYLDISSIDNKARRITDPKIYKGVEAPSRARQIVKTNDILFSTVRTYLKNIAVVDEIYNDQIASTGFCVMRCCGIINSRLLFRFVSSDVFIDRLNGFQRGISYPAVKTSDLLEQPIPLPPLPEQKEIVPILENLLDHEDEAKVLIDMEEEIDLLEKSILSKAFRGELGTNDPGDEPAIELLKRSLKEKMNVSQSR